jgi:predicted component of type VI protein secretion system
MYEVVAIIHGEQAANKRFSSWKKINRYISDLLETYECQIQEEYYGINGHELVASYNTRFYVNPVSK